MARSVATSGVSVDVSGTERDVWIVLWVRVIHTHYRIIRIHGDEGLHVDVISARMHQWSRWDSQEPIPSVEENCLSGKLFKDSFH